MQELWRAIRGCPGYSVSNMGRVLSGRFNRILRGQSTEGYRIVDIRRNKKQKLYKIHRLVLETFVGKCPEGMQCNHKDGNKANNRLSNLEWITPLENIQHAEKTGLRNSRGETNGRAKMKEEDILKIRSLWKSGLYTQDKLGKMFGIAHSTVGYIVNRKLWSHIGEINHDKT